MFFQSLADSLAYLNLDLLASVSPHPSTQSRSLRAEFIFFPSLIWVPVVGGAPVVTLGHGGRATVCPSSRLPPQGGMSSAGGGITRVAARYLLAAP